MGEGGGMKLLWKQPELACVCLAAHGAGGGSRLYTFLTFVGGLSSLVVIPILPASRSALLRLNCLVVVLLLVLLLFLLLLPLLLLPAVWYCRHRNYGPFC